MSNDMQMAWWLVFYNDQLLLQKKKDGTLALPCGEISPVALPKESTIHQVMMLENLPCNAFAVSAPIEETDKYILVGLRATYDCLCECHHQLAGKAHQILHWDTNTRFCSACGTPMVQQEAVMKKCPVCHKEAYPTISTAILALVQKEDSILLVHAHNFSSTFSSLVAGFLETGETLEACVAREVKEETGLDIDNITYFGNQPWPYPSGLMVGFFAQYVGGEIRLQKEELSAGGFFTRDNLPELPRRLSLARKMIDWWIENGK